MPLKAEGVLAARRRRSALSSLELLGVVLPPPRVFLWSSAAQAHSCHRPAYVAAGCRHGATCQSRQATLALSCAPSSHLGTLPALLSCASRTEYETLRARRREEGTTRDCMANFMQEPRHIDLRAISFLARPHLSRLCFLCLLVAFVDFSEQ
mmetsp:Transcript_14238/g.43112  ORF Transcript_14238/g.43112 Transcript_14238/m.43112 type:complete len:152 (+) Transcript_14238:1539-1994(+)